MILHKKRFCFEFVSWDWTQGTLPDSEFSLFYLSLKQIIHCNPSRPPTPPVQVSLMSSTFSMPLNPINTFQIPQQHLRASFLQTSMRSVSKIQPSLDFSLTSSLSFPFPHWPLLLYSTSIKRGSQRVGSWTLSLCLFSPQVMLSLSIYNFSPQLLSLI